MEYYETKNRDPDLRTRFFEILVRPPGVEHYLKISLLKINCIDIANSTPRADIFTFTIMKKYHTLLLLV